MFFAINIKFIYILLIKIIKYKFNFFSQLYNLDNSNGLSEVLSSLTKLKKLFVYLY